MSLEEIKTELINKQISQVIDDERSSDCGLTIKFTDGTKLSFGYSGCEGSTSYNNQIITELN